MNNWVISFAFCIRSLVGRPRSFQTQVFAIASVRSTSPDRTRALSEFCPGPGQDWAQTRQTRVVNVVDISDCFTPRNPLTLDLGVGSGAAGLSGRLTEQFSPRRDSLAEATL